LKVGDGHRDNLPKSAARDQFAETFDASRYHAVMRRSTIFALARVSALVVMTSLSRFSRADNAADAYRAAFAKLPVDDKSNDILENWTRPVDDTSRAVADLCGRGFEINSTARFDGALVVVEFGPDAIK
jgi:hypothetical protein